MICQQYAKNSPFNDQSLCTETVVFYCDSHWSSNGACLHISGYLLEESLKNSMSFSPGSQYCMDEENPTQFHPITTGKHQKSTQLTFSQICFSVIPFASV